MAAFIAKQMVGDKLSSVKGKCIESLWQNYLNYFIEARSFFPALKPTLDEEDLF